MRNLAIIALLLFCPTHVVTEVTPRKVPVERRLVIVVDASCSMDEPDYELAEAAMQLILSQPIDDAEVCVRAFADRSARWPSAGWRQMPDAKIAPEAIAWLRGQITSGSLGGETKVVAALSEALAESGPRSVFLISDGLFSGDILAAMMLVGNEPVGCVSVGAPTEAMKTLGGRGGCHRVD